MHENRCAKLFSSFPRQSPENDHRGNSSQRDPENSYPVISIPQNAERILGIDKCFVFEQFSDSTIWLTMLLWAFVPSAEMKRRVRFGIFTSRKKLIHAILIESLLFCGETEIVTVRLMKCFNTSKMRTPIWMPDALSYQGDQEDVRPLRGETPRQVRSPTQSAKPE